MNVLRTILTISTAVAAASACKVRDPDAGGLLSAGGASPEMRGWLIQCEAEDSGDSGAKSAVYLWQVDDAGEAVGEARAFQLSVWLQRGSESRALVEPTDASGSISAAGSIVVSFAEGLLTAEPVSRPEDPRVGVMTLLQEPDLAGVNVRCQVAVKGPQG